MQTRPDRYTDTDTDQPWLGLPGAALAEEQPRHPALGADRGGMGVDLLPRHCLAGGALRAAEASLNRREGCSDTAHPGTWLLGRACREAQDWNAVQDVPRITPGGVTRFSPAVMVAVSLPAMKLDNALVAQTSLALSQSGLAPWLLEIEISDQAVLDGEPDQVACLSALRALGVGVALDNFGSVTASPHVLRRLKLTAVKLDPRLMHDLTQDREKRATVKAAIAMAHGLGASVVATGVQTVMQRDILADLGCDDAQGPLFGRAMRPEAFLAALMKAVLF
jgi:EAL domain-containing protein (putative c-di-GMP-specific phosphodiesterase class I)